MEIAPAMTDPISLAAANADQTANVDLPLAPKLPEDPDQVLPLAADTSFARSATASAAWTRVTQLIDTEMPHGRGLEAPQSFYFDRIEKGFLFAARSEDQDFIYLHVEPLLDQAADLLDRGIRERAQWDDLAAKAATLGLEIAEYKALDAIHTEEEKQGFYNNDWLEAQGEIDAAEATRSALVTAEQYQRSAVTGIQTDYNAAYNANRKAAFVNGLVAYSFGDAPFKGYQNHTWDGVGYTVSALSIQAAEVLSDYAYTQAYNSNQSQTYSLTATIEGIKRKQPYTSAINQWNYKNITFRKQRTIASRNIQDVKARAATDPDGLLNYAKRLPAIQKRFQADFRNALARLKSAEQGMIKLFGYDVALPTNAASISYFDDCLNWTRDAVHWLIRFARREQSTVVVVSLRQLVGLGWVDALLDGKLEFSMNEDQFGGASCVRLRGVALHLVRAAKTAEPHRLMRARVHVPKTARVRRQDGTLIDIDQSELPPCHFGRLDARNAVRVPDIFGSASLHNASPLGDWMVELLGFVGEGASVTDLDDIELDVHVGFRMV
jgi:hypothetical protein